MIDLETYIIDESIESLMNRDCVVVTQFLSNNIEELEELGLLYKKLNLNFEIDELCEDNSYNFVLRLFSNTYIAN